MQFTHITGVLQGLVFNNDTLLINIGFHMMKEKNRL